MEYDGSFHAQALCRISFHQRGYCSALLDTIKMNRFGSYFKTKTKQNKIGKQKTRKKSETSLVEKQSSLSHFLTKLILQLVAVGARRKTAVNILSIFFSENLPNNNLLKLLADRKVKAENFSGGIESFENGFHHKTIIM